MEKINIPNHVAIILDGNGRWAQEQGKSRSYGHKKGFENLRSIAKYIFSQNVKVLSVYAFSTENFKREKDEVNFLMNLFVNEFKKGLQELITSGIKIVFSGRKEKPLPQKVITVMNKLEQETKNNDKGIFNICINYGGQAEIIDATKKIAKDILANNLDINNINEETYQKYLYQELPPIDLLIRTSGELRISNFMLWQLSYTEFYFPKTYFPAFSTDDFDEAIKIYNNRNRRFGNIKK